MFIFIQGWMRTTQNEVLNSTNDTKCSIIIAARNEAGQIENILSDIIQQEYPKHLFEIIVINDHSEDDTAKIVSFFQQGNTLTLIDLVKGKSGKKDAINEGVILANGELILTLDADCRIGKKWLSTMVHFYNDKGSSLIVGPVDFSPKKGFWNEIQNLEFLSLVGTSACATNNGQAFLCNGANLAYKRKVFMEIEDPLRKDISSGEDVFFMHKIKKRSDASIHFIKHQDAIAYTDGVKDFKSFLSQRIRWASKSKLIDDSESLVFIVIISIMNLFLIFLFFLSFFNAKVLFVFLGCFGSKLIVDYAFFKQILPFFKKENLIKHIPLTNFLYFLYFASMILFTIIIKPTWKGRAIKV